MELEFVKGWPEQWRKEVAEYLAGKRQVFSVKPRLEGTEFQKAVWREMQKIPYGQTRSYGEIAVAIGRPKAVRAAGSACGKNAFPIIVPCHRVVAARGIGGFGLGLDLKRRLLKLEQKYKSAGV
jgi:methylated-DNA-[protein]-cysteine S-methyltransferase